MADKRVSEMTKGELRATITAGVFVGLLGILAIGALIVAALAIARMS